MRAALESGEVIDELHPGTSIEFSEKASQGVGSPRPTGERPMFWGWIGITVGILMSVLGVMIDAFTLVLIGGGMANLSLVSLVAGYIVQAISFLPGKRK